MLFGVESGRTYGAASSRRWGSSCVNTEPHEQTTNKQDADGKIIIIDEVHTPDSSRYWVKETYDARQAQVRAMGLRT